MAIQTPKTQASEAFILAYGDAMVQWANVEILLALWFGKITLMPNPEAAQAVFFSARSFRGRSDMFVAALDHLDAPAEHLELLREAALKAIAYSNVRNELAHGFVHGSDKGESITSGAAFIRPGKITLKELRAAAANFAELRRILYAAMLGLSRDEGGQPISKCLERLRKLPNEACSSELSQKQKGRLRQLQAVFRRKSKPQ